MRWPDHDRSPPSPNPSGGIALLPCLVLALAAGPARASSGGPDGFGYRFWDSAEPDGPTYSWEEISATGTPLSLSPETHMSIPVGFDFPFYGETWDWVEAQASGCLTLGWNTGLDFVNSPLPYLDGAGTPMVCAAWDFWNCDPHGTVFYETLGTAPERRLVVQFDDVAWSLFCDDVHITFEIILHESGDIRMLYEDMQAEAPCTSPTSGAEATAGIQHDAAWFLQYSYEQPVLTSGLALRFDDCSLDDEDGDGFSDCDGDCDDGDPLLEPADADGDGVSTCGGDCDDGAATTFLGAPETCNGVDNDCDGLVGDEDDDLDADGDGYGSCKEDCDDSDPDIHPGGVEWPYDGIDQDCNGADLTDADGDGFDGGQKGEDCDDTDPGAYPGAEEICGDGIDQDCDGVGDHYDFDCEEEEGDDDTGGDAGPNGGDYSEGCSCSSMRARPTSLLALLALAAAAMASWRRRAWRSDGSSMSDPEHLSRFTMTGLLVAALLGVPISTCPALAAVPVLIDFDDAAAPCDLPSTTALADEYQDIGVTFAGPQPLWGGGVLDECWGQSFNPAWTLTGHSSPNVLAWMCDVNTHFNDGGSACDPETLTFAAEVSVVSFSASSNNGNIAVDVSAYDVQGILIDSASLTTTTAFQLVELSGAGIVEVVIDADWVNIWLGGVWAIDDLYYEIDLDQDGDGWAVFQGDCDDTDPSVYPGAPEICDDGIDQNCDGVVDELADHDGDGFSNCAGDCDDTDDTRFPGAIETCNLIDDDCDGLVDEDFDTDGDGFSACTDPADCDDTDPTVYPGAPEICSDGVDQDCDGVVDEPNDADGDGWDPCLGDCDDGDADTYPGAPELCDAMDNDCDGVVPPGETTDGDGDGYVTCADCDDGDGSVNPDAMETCDGLDNDCDGVVDEGFDADGDGVSPCAGDCDDDDPDTYPGAPEACDGLDNDCDGVLLEYEEDGDGDGFMFCQGDCDDDDPDIHPDATEVCNGLDDDCDGLVDDEDDDLDGDGDGFGGCEEDCDDTNPEINPEGSEVPYDGIDQDCDGEDLADLDGDGYDGGPLGEDCDDDDPAINPGATEICDDGADGDCDGIQDPFDDDCWEPQGDDDDTDEGQPDDSAGDCSCSAVPLQPFPPLPIFLLVAAASFLRLRR